MERPDTHTLIAAYALDAVDEDEREVFEQHLASCEGCREDVDGLKRTVLRLADSAVVAFTPAVFWIRYTSDAWKAGHAGQR